MVNRGGMRGETWWETRFFEGLKTCHFLRLYFWAFPKWDVGGVGGKADFSTPLRFGRNDAD
jgi:hypothetical protein